jgi:hypothetical protein
MFNQNRLTLKHNIALKLRQLHYGKPEQKVFCVGLQKTGTTSLQYALSMLGFRVAGYFSVNDLSQQPEMWQRAETMLPQFDAFADNPWPLYFRELDSMFPDAKFILTTRDPERWYASVCKHFGESESQMRRWVYGAGSPIGNKKDYISKLTGHQADVRKHFTGRPNDLIEFDVVQGDGWGKLCNFLGKSVPSKAFPRLNTAQMRS